MVDTKALVGHVGFMALDPEELKGKSRWRLYNSADTEKLHMF